MQKNTIIALVILILVVGGLIYYFRRQPSPTPQLPQLTPQPSYELPTPTEAPVFEVPTGTIKETPTKTPTGTTKETPTKVKTETSKETPTKTPSEVAKVSEVTIKITESGFQPKEITINKGTKVTWVNEANFESWPASAVHPTHRVYPGSGIEKCGTPEARNIFDACRGLKKGESWSFVFNEVGEWGYHDHLNPSLRGKIIVK